MPFKALNIESDDESEEEPDRTREIAVEDAIRNYQTALKNQTRGTAYLSQTTKAYEDLFKSDIFRFPEASSIFSRVEAAQDAGIDDAQLQGTWEPETQVVAFDPESATSTLAQVVHLAYKNRGEHHVDEIRADLKLQSGSGGSQQSQLRNSRAKLALKDFAEALDKDEDDIELWRRAARVGQMLGSRRTTRFCNEVVLDVQVETDDLVTGVPPIESNIVAEELDDLHIDLQDDLSMLAETKPKDKSQMHMPQSWLKHMMVFPDLPLSPPESPNAIPRTDLPEYELWTTEPSWTSIGSSLKRQLDAERKGEIKLALGTTVRLCCSTDVTQMDEATSPVEGSTVEQIAALEQASGNNETQDTSPVTATEAQELLSPMEVETLPDTPLPIRKRSADQAEIAENNDESGPVRSKRLKARKSLVTANHAEAGTAEAPSATDRALAEMKQADEYLFEVIDHLAQKMGFRKPSSPSELRSQVGPSASQDAVQAKIPLGIGMQDLYTSMLSWTQEKTDQLLGTGSNNEPSKDFRTVGVDAFFGQAGDLPSSKEDIKFNASGADFIKWANEYDGDTVDIAVRWLVSLLSSAYATRHWPLDLKVVANDLLVDLDDVLSHTFVRILDSLQNISTSSTGREDNSADVACASFGHRGNKLNLERTPEVFSPGSKALDLHTLNHKLHFAQAAFEMHLDTYYQMIRKAIIASEELALQRMRLERWRVFASECMVLEASLDGRQVDDKSIVVRNLWATALYLHLTRDASREHVLALFGDLRRLVQLEKLPSVQLPNNVVMPDLSIAAAEKEITKLQTMDFFINIFNNDTIGNVELAEALEPVLERTRNVMRLNAEDVDSKSSTAHETEDEAAMAQAHTSQPTSSGTQNLNVLSEFLSASNTSLLLSLWKRLAKAYETMAIPSKVISVNLRCMEVILDGLKSDEYKNRPVVERQKFVLEWTGDLTESLLRISTLLKEHKEILTYFEAADILVYLNIVGDAFTLLYSLALFDEYTITHVKQGTASNPFKWYKTDSFHTTSIRLHDAQIHAGLLIFNLVAVGLRASSDDASVSDAEVEELSLLRHIHYHFGMRRTCKASDNALLEFMKEHLMQMSWENLHATEELAQVLYDLYDINCFSNTALNCQDHGCYHDYLDRNTTLHLLDFIMTKALKAPVKDLLKSDLGKTIEKMNTTIGMGKSSPGNLRNKEIIASYLKSNVDARDIYRSSKGLVELPLAPVGGEEASLASSGWYFLKGQIAFAKYSAQHAKSVQAEEEDLREAINCFTDHLACVPDHWESWVRLAQVYDAMLEEHVLWSAEKLNDYSLDIDRDQRHAINAYKMALSTSMRGVDETADSTAKIVDLLSKFATRIYSSTRPPFSSCAPNLWIYAARHYVSSQGGGDHTYEHHNTVQPSTAWNIAATLFRKAIALKSKDWMNHLMLGKCLWKLYSKTDKDPRKSSLPVQTAYLNAIQALPARKDANRQDPILEPMYKCVSLAKKLVKAGDISEAEGRELINKCFSLQMQLDKTKLPSFKDFENWNKVVFEAYKHLRAADKSRWHHRIAFEIAALIEQQSADGTGTKAAKDYLAEQHMYSTKTLQLSVWKPDSERAGRHWVYMSRYARVIARLFQHTDDLEAMQLLARRVRKKNTDFFEHTKLWKIVCQRHVELLRRYGAVPTGHADEVFQNIDKEEFSKYSPGIDAWASSTSPYHPLQAVLRETAEIKKLNAGLTAIPQIDELLADTYAAIWKQIVPTLPPPAPLPSPASAPLPTMETSTPPNPERRNVMSLDNLMNVDGSTEVIARPTAPPVIASGEPIVKARPRMISKREVVKRATDSGMTKLAVPPKKKTTSTEDAPTEESAKTSGEARNEDEEMDDEEDVQNNTADGDMVRQSSPPASIHDSADDESEGDEIIVGGGSDENHGNDL